MQKLRIKRNFYELPSYVDILFNENIKLLPTVNELFELELAYLEYHSLSESELLDRSAYFQSINGKCTKHFLTYSNCPETIIKDRSTITKKYFENGIFSTGYATHSLFPYRGKFHPQLIKALLNIIGIKKGEIVLDPMCGSGTANVEAALMGINSYAVDISPFCQFMTKTKYESLSLSKDFLSRLSNKADQLFDFFNTQKIFEKLRKIKNPAKQKVYNFALLAFLDAMGYSKRVVNSNHKQLFRKVLFRYVKTVDDFLSNPYFTAESLGWVKILSNSDALNLNLKDNSIDGIIVSPPYSFAIDYAKNDESQLKYLGYDVLKLKSKMIGLVGKNRNERLKNYFQAMRKACSEVYGVLKRGKYFIMIIGSNTNQTGGIRLENTIIKNCDKIGLSLMKSILKPIKGIRNTMKDEYMLIFKKI